MIDPVLISLSEQIVCISRQITRMAMNARASESPEVVREIATMRAILQTLIKLRAAEKFREEGKA